MLSDNTDWMNILIISCCTDGSHFVFGREFDLALKHSYHSMGMRIGLYFNVGLVIKIQKSMVIHRFNFFMIFTRGRVYFTNRNGFLPRISLVLFMSLQ